MSEKKKAHEKPVEEAKAVTLPLNQEEQAAMKQWKQDEQSSRAPFKFFADISPEETTYGITSLSKRGSKQEQKDLGLAGLCLTMGVKHTSFATRLFVNCAGATGLCEGKKPEEQVSDFNAVADALHAMKPADEIESMLIGRLIALHFQAMSYLETSSNRKNQTQIREMHVNRATKLFRVYNETLEALMRYRRKGEQKVVVQHVNVAPGGQAVVGDIHQGGGGSGKF